MHTKYSGFTVYYCCFCCFSLGRVVFFFVSRQGPRAKSMRESERKKKQTQKKKQHHILWQPMYPANQQNLDTQLAATKWQNCCSLSIAHATLHKWRVFTVLVTVWQCNKIHFASMCSRRSTMITDHWVHGDLQCRSLHDQLFAFFSTQLSKSMHMIGEKQRKKRHGLI